VAHLHDYRRVYRLDRWPVRLRFRTQLVRGGMVDAGAGRSHQRTSRTRLRDSMEAREFTRRTAKNPQVCFYRHNDFPKWQARFVKMLNGNAISLRPFRIQPLLVTHHVHDQTHAYCRRLRCTLRNSASRRPAASRRGGATATTRATG
jgi:hypothetical protein